MKFFGIIFLLLVNMVIAKPIRASEDIYSNIKYEAGKDYLVEQLGISEQKDHFGRDFFADPKDFKKILALVDPELATQGKWQSMGIQPWPNNPGNFLFIACENKANQDEQFFCSNPSQGKTIIALLKYNAKKEFTLAAKPWINHSVDKEDDSNDHNTAFLLRNGDSNEIIGRGRPTGFDFTPYRLSPKIPAFGLKYIVTHNQHPAKTIDEGVMLFAVINGHLRQVFNAPTYHLAYDAEIADDGSIHLHSVSDEKIYQIIISSNSFYKGMYYVDWINKRAGALTANRYVWNGTEQYKAYISYGYDEKK